MSGRSQGPTGTSTRPLGRGKACPSIGQRLFSARFSVTAPTPHRTGAHGERTNETDLRKTRRRHRKETEVRLKRRRSRRWGEEEAENRAAHGHGSRGEAARDLGQRVLHQEPPSPWIRQPRE